MRTSPSGTPRALRRLLLAAGILVTRSEELFRIGQCSVAPDTPSFDVVWRWEAKLQRQSYNKSVFGRTANLYVNDRCFVPRRVCKVHVRGVGATLLLPRDGPSTVALSPKSYGVVLGAAQVMGVVARTSFASIIEHGGGLPLINLGKGAAGPHIYTDPTNWPVLAPLFVNAQAIVICVMAGRSSSNSESGTFSGQSFGSEQLRAYERVQSLWRGASDEERRHGERLRLESLDTAKRDYMELARRVRAGSPPGQPPPRILLVWFSSCPIAGCSELWEYPQYYLRDGRTPWSKAGGRAAGGGGGGGGGEANVLASLGRALGAEVVDASYGHLPPSPPLAVDQCASCVTAAPLSAVCNSPGARTEAQKVGRTCGSTCGAVRDPYYPDDAAHEHAARVVDAVLKSPPPAAPLWRAGVGGRLAAVAGACLLYTSPSPRDLSTSRMPSSA